jgi:sugar fermentation stimulation protein A
MKFASPLSRGKLLRRYKRFLADVILDKGEIVTAACPNTGAFSFAGPVSTPGSRDEAGVLA